MKKMICFVSFAAGLSACDVASPDDDATAGAGGVEQMCGQALTSENGMRVNGMRVNGMRVNGMRVNGMRVNGMRVNGMRVNGVNLKGNELVGNLSNGSEVRGVDLINLEIQAVLSTGESVSFKVTGVEPDPEQVGSVLYTLEFGGENVCGDGGKGMFVPGVWDDTVTQHDQMVVGSHTIDTTFSCTTGVIAKCARMGYRPWVEGKDAHQTCTRMLRADYCGDGVGHTKDGTLVNVFDRIGVQKADNAPDLTFEAGWGINGAVCVRETRYASTNADGSRKYPSCWAALPRCETWSDAQALNAVIGNDSAHTPLMCGP